MVQTGNAAGKMPQGTAYRGSVLVIGLGPGAGLLGVIGFTRILHRGGGGILAGPRLHLAALEVFTKLCGQSLIAVGFCHFYEGA